jgi:hypothetical protein
VVDASNGRPVAQALVTATGAAGARASVRADSAGVYTLAVPGAGPVRLEAGRLGYEGARAEVTAGPGQTVELDLALVPARLEMDSLTVTARPEPPRDERLRRVGFYDREEAGQGRFVRGDDVRPRRFRRISDVMRALVPGYAFAYAARIEGEAVRIDGEVVSIEGEADRNPRDGGCAPRIFLDGVLLGEGLAVLDRSLRPEDLAGLEVYRGASQLPPRFGGSDAACGAVVAWSGAG